MKSFKAGTECTLKKPVSCPDNGESLNIGKNMQQYGIFPKFGKPISADPNSYTIKEGINHKEAMNFINILANHSYLGKKILSSIKNEEYFIIEKLSN